MIKIIILFILGISNDRGGTVLEMSVKSGNFDLLVVRLIRIIYIQENLMCVKWVSNKLVKLLQLSQLISNCFLKAILLTLNQFIIPAPLHTLQGQGYKSRSKGMLKTDFLTKLQLFIFLHYPHL